MKIFQKPDRKTYMHGSNQDNSQLNTSQKYNQMIQKQLEDDFKVCQYLNQNPSDNQNSVMYIALLNTMLSRKKRKKQMKMSLMSTKASNDLPFENEVEMKDENNFFISQISMTQSAVFGIKQKHDYEEERILNRFAEEAKIHQNLQQEIEINKKSLILMKGDIKQMIDRQKSIQTLQVKINKESIISNNQLKRVSMALMKDREQVSLLQDMQKKFGEKLKSMGQSEAKNVLRTRANFVQLMNKRKAIFERLIESQKQCASIQQFSDKVKQKNQKNKKSINYFLLLQFLSQKISQLTELQIQFKEKSIDVKSYCNLVKQYLSSHAYESHQMEAQILNQQLQQKLNGFLTNILNEYSRLVRQIEEKNNIFRDMMGLIKQNEAVTNEQDLKTQQISYDFTLQRQKQQLKYNINPSQYIQNIRNLQGKIKIICILINFMDKRIPSFTGTRFVNELYNHLDWYFKIHVDEQKKTQKDFDHELFNKILSSIKFWFTQLHNFILQSQTKAEIKLKAQVFPESFDHSNKKNKTWSRPEDCSPQKTRRHGKLKTATTLEMDQKQFEKALEKDDDESYENFQINRLSSCVTTEKNGNSPQKSQQQQSKGKITRVELLEKIDNNYYKMIKQTLKMEKQNTRKNYNFEKTFKRDKYSSQDQLMQEKRFQSTFSSTFKHDQQRMFKTSTEFKSRKMIKQSLHLRNTFSNSCSSIKNQKQCSQKAFKTPIKHSTVWQKQKKTKMKLKLKMIFQQTLNF